MNWWSYAILILAVRFFLDTLLSIVAFDVTQHYQTEGDIDTEGASLQNRFLCNYLSTGIVDVNTVMTHNTYTKILCKDKHHSKHVYTVFISKNTSLKHRVRKIWMSLYQHWNKPKPGMWGNPTSALPLVTLPLKHLGSFHHHHCFQGPTDAILVQIERHEIEKFVANSRKSIYNVVTVLVDVASSNQ